MAAAYFWLAAAVTVTKANKKVVDNLGFIAFLNNFKICFFLFFSTLHWLPIRHFISFTADTLASYQGCFSDTHTISHEVR